MIKELKATELKQMLDSNEDFLLIDVREPMEAEIASIGGKLIPLQSLPQHISEFKTDQKIVVYCRSGARSASAIQYVQQQTGHAKLYNLKGGILAWADNIDPSVQKY